MKEDYQLTEKTELGQFENKIMLALKNSSTLPENVKTTITNTVSEISKSTEQELLQPNVTYLKRLLSLIEALSNNDICSEDKIRIFEGFKRFSRSGLLAPRTQHQVNSVAWGFGTTAGFNVYWWGVGAYAANMRDSDPTAGKASTLGMIGFTILMGIGMGMMWYKNGGKSKRNPNSLLSQKENVVQALRPTFEALKADPEKTNYQSIEMISV